MARRKKPESETKEQERCRKIKLQISDAYTRSEKTSWNRKMDNMNVMYERIRTIENLILDLQVQKMPLFDQLQQLREQMVQECIHPYDQLEVYPTHVECKFCGRKISLPKEQ